MPLFDVFLRVHYNLGTEYHPTFKRQLIQTAMSDAGEAERFRHVLPALKEWWDAPLFPLGAFMGQDLRRMRKAFNGRGIGRWLFARRIKGGGR